MMFGWFRKKSEPKPNCLVITNPAVMGVILSRDGKSIQISCNGQWVLFARGINQLFVRDEFTGTDTMRNMELKP